MPSGILVHTIGYGLLAGIDVYDVVLILRNRKAVNAFANPKLSLGAEISVTAGDAGAGAMLDTGIEIAPVLSYVKGKGVYGGIQLDGVFPVLPLICFSPSGPTQSLIIFCTIQGTLLSSARTRMRDSMADRLNLMISYPLPLPPRLLPQSMLPLEALNPSIAQ